MKPTIHGLLGRIRPVMVVASCIGVVMAYLIGTFVTGPFHQASSSMGAMLACTSAVVVLQTPGLRESLRAGLLRVAGTALGALLAYAYLRLFAFSTLGMMLAVALLVVLSMLLGIPDNGRMATITLLAILLVSQRSHALPPGVNCLLRFVESALGVAVGVVLAWLTSHLSPAAHPAANSCPARLQLRQLRPRPQLLLRLRHQRPHLPRPQHRPHPPLLRPLRPLFRSLRRLPQRLRPLRLRFQHRPQRPHLHPPPAPFSLRPGLPPLRPPPAPPSTPPPLPSTPPPLPSPPFPEPLHPLPAPFSLLPGLPPLPLSPALPPPLPPRPPRLPRPAGSKKEPAPLRGKPVPEVCRSCKPGSVPGVASGSLSFI